MTRKERQVLAVCLTVMLCISFGIALHSWAGVCIGICIGVPFGLFGSEKDDEDENQGREDQ